VLVLVFVGGVVAGAVPVRLWIVGGGGVGARVLGVSAIVNRISLVGRGIAYVCPIQADLPVFNAHFWVTGRAGEIAEFKLSRFCLLTFLVPCFDYDSHCL